MSNKSDRRTILTRETTAVSIVAALACVLSSEANASRPVAEANVGAQDLATRAASIVEWIRLREPTILRDLPAVTKMAQWRNR
jgi:hypothetical protein